MKINFTGGSDAGCIAGYWNGEKCVAYSHPKNCSVGWEWNERSYNCTKMPTG